MMAGLLIYIKNIVNTKFLIDPRPINKMMFRMVSVDNATIDLHEGYATVGVNLDTQP